jgi:hypothetical protein
MVPRGPLSHRKTGIKQHQIEAWKRNLVFAVWTDAKSANECAIEQTWA